MPKGVDKKAVTCYNFIVSALADTQENTDEVWLSLVERYVREQITDYKRKNAKTAETP